MAITVVTANVATDEQTPDNFANIVHSFSHTLANGSGNNRLVIMQVCGMSNQSGDLSVDSGPTYDGSAPTGSVTFFSTSSGGRDFNGIYWWDDSDLPASSGTYTAAITLTGCGADPNGYSVVTETTGVDQTTPKSETEDTAEDYGTTQQSYTPSTGGGLIVGNQLTIGGGSVDATTTWNTGTALADFTRSGPNEGHASMGYSTSGAIAATSSADHDVDSWLAVAFTAAAAGGGISVDLATLSITAYNPVITLNVQADSATISLAEQQPTLTQDYQVNTATLSIAEQKPTLTFNYMVQRVQLTLSGLAATITKTAIAGAQKFRGFMVNVGRGMR